MATVGLIGDPTGSHPGIQHRERRGEPFDPLIGPDECFVFTRQLLRLGLLLRVFEAPLNAGAEIGKPVQCASLFGLDSCEGSCSLCDVESDQRIAEAG